MGFREVRESHILRTELDGKKLFWDSVARYSSVKCDLGFADTLNHVKCTSL